MGCITPEIPGKLPGEGVGAVVAGWLAGAVTADGSVENFQRKRLTEIKHGRTRHIADPPQPAPRQPPAPAQTRSTRWRWRCRTRAPWGYRGQRVGEASNPGPVEEERFIE
eukprot:12932026-Prorocentrum_lima.AAC.1